MKTKRIVVGAYLQTKKFIISVDSIKNYCEDLLDGDVLDDNQKNTLQYLIDKKYSDANEFFSDFQMNILSNFFEIVEIYSETFWLSKVGETKGYDNFEKDCEFEIDSILIHNIKKHKRAFFDKNKFWVEFFGHSISDIKFGFLVLNK